MRNSLRRLEGGANDGEQFRLIGNTVSQDGTAGGDWAFESEQETSSEPSEWAIAMSDPDRFFSTVYRYHYEGGKASAVTRKVLQLIRAAFIVGFTTFLALYVDWTKTFSCGSDSCGPLLRVHPWKLDTPRRVYLLLELGFLGYMFMLLWQAVELQRTMSQMARFYQTILGIDENELQTVSWDVVVNKVIDAISARHIYRVGPLDATIIARRVMRSEDYVAGMAQNAEVLGTHATMTKTLRWNLDYLIQWMIVRESFYDDEEHEKELQRKLRWLGVVNLIAMPFILTYVIVSACFEYGAEARLAPGRLGLRQWSSRALHLFRKPHELPHAFEQRMGAVYPLAQEYVESFPYPVLKAIARTVVFIAGGFAVTIILVGLENPAALINVQITVVFEQNLLGLLSELSLIVVIGLSVAGSPNPAVQAARTSEELLEKVMEGTGYAPGIWRDKGPHHPDVRAAFLRLFQYRPFVFAREIVSVIETPWIMLWILPHRASSILSFVQECTDPQPSCGIGPAYVERRRKGDEHEMLLV